MTVFRRLLLLLVSCLVTGMAGAQEASFDGSILRLPAVDVDGVKYQLELIIVPDSSPVELRAISGEPTEVDSVTVGSFTNNVLTIPSLVIENTSYYVNLALVDPDALVFRLIDSGVSEATSGTRGEAEDLFVSSFESNVVQTQCVSCHVAGGVAQASSLVFVNSSDTSASENFATLEALLNSRADGQQYILGRVSGNDHPGGNQLPEGSVNYLALESILMLLQGQSSNGPSQDIQFFSAVTQQTYAETLRKASIVLAGRLPTSDEIAIANGGNESEIRSVLENLMQGEAFHEFLLDGANDQLLIRGIRDSDLLEACVVCFPAFTNRLADLRLQAQGDGEEISPELDAYLSSVDHGLLEAPLELIAYVVENDRPYSEVLTANYTMLNPATNAAMEGTASFSNPSDMTEFRPGVVTGAYVPTEEMEYEELEEIESIRITDPGSGRLDFPHAGVLNTIGFLKRYPSTATNRNRARARWAFFHFLGLDIERSAPRTTDPVALADTNNPTLFNENCTVCHGTLDPVAGAFQNYSDDGFYRIHGLDSLDEFYKYPEDDSVSLYEYGDTWYRDMREPGIFGNSAPHADNSVQWLAAEIVNDPTFAAATVKFWWPAIIGTEVLSAPEEAGDGDYDAQLAAYNAQDAAIQEFASNFTRSGLNLKNLLVEMVLSPWFGSAAVDSAQLTSSLLLAHEIAELGSEKLLTPERLQRKTLMLTGFNWNAYQNAYTSGVVTGFGDIYRLFYGGINSQSITERAREMTPLMSTVAMSHALESACPIVLKEFMLPSSERLLFEGIEETTTPTNGESQIRAKLVQLHARLLGKTYATDSREIDDAYQLYTLSWQERVDSGAEGYLFTESEYCEFYRDEGFFDGTEIESTAKVLVTENGETFEEFNWEAINDFLDPHLEDIQHTKQAWITVITYLMTHYHYLYE